MSLAADPNQTFEYSLEADLALPEKQRPVFYIKFMTTRQWRQLVEFREKLKDMKSGIEMSQAIIEQVKPYIRGWKNVFHHDPQGFAAAQGHEGHEVKKEIPFDPEKIEYVLSLDDMYELVSAENNRQFLTAEDKKKLD